MTFQDGTTVHLGAKKKLDDGKCIDLNGKQALSVLYLPVPVIIISLQF